jgi:hypothetical protein
MFKHYSDPGAARELLTPVGEGNFTPLCRTLKSKVAHKGNAATKGKRTT